MLELFYRQSFNIKLQTRGDPVKGKILELIQVWGHAFRNEARYKVVQDTFNLMKLEGKQNGLLVV